MTERMSRAFEVSGRAFRAQLGKTKPEDEEQLRRVESGEIVVVPGRYDRVESVLRALAVPFASISPDQLEGADWNQIKALMINCPGHLPGAALEILRDWVARGGTLLTTDWALKHTLEPAFPGAVRHNGRQTPDCVVRVETLGQDPLLEGFLEDGREPLWWLEGASFPVEVLDPERVRVLVRSAEVGRQWGAEAVVVKWQQGEGEVVHMLSHLYLQRSETRSRRDAMPAAAYLKDAGLSQADAQQLAADAGDLRASELKSAWTTAGLASKLIVERKKKDPK